MERGVCGEVGPPQGLEDFLSEHLRTLLMSLFPLNLQGLRVGRLFTLLKFEGLCSSTLLPQVRLK